MEVLKVGIVGCGRIAEAHLNALSSLKDKFEVSAVYDLDEKRAESISKKFGINEKPKLEELLSNTKLDLISVTVPDGFHYDIVKKVLLSHKNVLVEKPIALNISEVNELIQIAKRENVFLGVVLQKRLFKIFKRAKETVDAGKIGNIFLTSLQQVWYRDDNYFAISWHGKKTLDGGLILNQSAHNIDLVEWISGPIRKVFTYGGQVVRQDIETEDTVAAVFETEKGIGNIMLTISSYPKNFGDLFEFIGNKGRILIGTGAFEQLTSKDFKEDLQELKQPTLSGYGHKLVYEEVYDKIKNGKNTIIDVNDAYHSFAVAFAMRKSIEEKREIDIGG
ncbi:MAG: Gfo/Idh/MocA family oxidoreductase [Actinomycetota bacterium]|nr:Gfo/Idh/MocA family oxidoreductase [Actinomycetota bacterium]